MTRQQYLEKAEEEIVGLTIKEAEEKGFHIVTERPERISVQAKVLVEMREDKIREVLEII